MVKGLCSLIKDLEMGRLSQSSIRANSVTWGMETGDGSEAQRIISQECGQSLEAEKSIRMDRPLGPPEGTSPADTLSLHH